MSTRTYTSTETPVSTPAAVISTKHSILVQAYKLQPYGSYGRAEKLLPYARDDLSKQGLQAARDTLARTLLGSEMELIKEWQIVQMAEGPDAQRAAQARWERKKAELSAERQTHFDMFVAHFDSVVKERGGGKLMGEKTPQEFRDEHCGLIIKDLERRLQEQNRLVAEALENKTSTHVLIRREFEGRSARLVAKGEYTGLRAQTLQAAGGPQEGSPSPASDAAGEPLSCGDSASSTKRWPNSRLPTPQGALYAEPFARAVGQHPQRVRPRRGTRSSGRCYKRCNAGVESPSARSCSSDSSWRV